MTITEEKQTLIDFVHEATRVFNKGGAIKASQDVVVLTNAPSLPDVPLRYEPVDVHFVMIGFTDAVELPADDYKAMLIDWLYQWYVTDPKNAGKEWLKRPDFLKAGIWDVVVHMGLDWPQLGKMIGNELLAMRLMALGAHYGLWALAIPEKIGGPPEGWDMMAVAGNMPVIVPDEEQLAEFAEKVRADLGWEA